MKNKLMTLCAAASLCATSAIAATNGINPESLKLKIYKVAVSTDPLCTDMITIFSSATPVYTDFLGSPTLGSGTVPAGTYNCVAIEFSSVIKPTPAETSTGSGACIQGTEFDLNVSNGTAYQLIDGTTGVGGATDTRIAMWLSTASTETTGTNGHSAFVPPTSVGSSTEGFLLSSPLVVSGDAAGTFVVNGSGQIGENGASCECGPPAFSFR
jgi:hypothetical protein